MELQTKQNLSFDSQKYITKVGDGGSRNIAS
jgi:hypothetical protein